MPTVTVWQGSGGGGLLVTFSVWLAVCWSVLCCDAARSIESEAALVQLSLRQRGSQAVYTSPSTEAMEMSFRVSSGTARLHEICWNPSDVIALDPKQYTMKLGYIQVVPAAGLQSKHSFRLVALLTLSVVEVQARGLRTG